MSRIWKLLTLSCRDTAGLVSRDLDDTLDRGERIALRMHVMICKACRRYRQHAESLRGLAREPEIPDDQAGMPDDARRRILAALERAADPPPRDR